MEKKKMDHIPPRFINPISWLHGLKAMGVAAGLVSLVSCASPELPLSGSLDQKGLMGNESSLLAREDMRTAFSANQEPRNLYHQMLQQGHYSDAAILQSLQEFKPGPTSLAPKFVDLTDISERVPLPDPSYSASPTNSTLGAGWHTKVGWTFILDGNYPAAEAAYRQALRHETESAEAYLGLGMALMFQGKRDQAIMAYEEALNIQPSYAAALVHLGYAYADSSNDHAESRIKAQSLFQQASDLGDPFALLALMGLKEKEEGI